MSSIYRSKYNQKQNTEDPSSNSENQSPLEQELHQRLDQLLDQLLDSFYDVLISSKGSVQLSNQKIEDKDVYKSFQDEYQLEVRTQSILKTVEEIISFNENLKKMILLNNHNQSQVNGKNSIEKLDRLKYLLEFKKDLKVLTNELYESLN